MDDDIYEGRSILAEILRLGRDAGRRDATGAEVLAADFDEQVGLAVECAFEKFVERGPRVTALHGGVFCITRAPKLYV